MRRSIVAILMVCVPLFVARAGSQQAQEAKPPKPVRLVLSELKYAETDDGRHVASRLKIYGVELASGGVTQLAAQEFDVSQFIVDRESLSSPSWTPIYVAIASGEYAYVVTRQATYKNTLSRFEPFNPKSKPINVDLGELGVTAMIEVAGKLYCGLPGEVRVVDFAEKEPSAKEFFSAHRTDNKKNKKTIDAFARCGDKVVAIDDVVWPKYAYVFKGDEKGLSAPYEADLPRGANSQYYEATGDGQRMALLEHFSHREAEGSRVEFYEVGDTELDYKLGRSEFVLRAKDEKPVLLAGDELTPFCGMAFIDDGLLVGAGSRGILTIYTDVFKKAALTSTTGECTDILMKDGRLFALVNNGVNMELVEFSISAAGLKEAARHKLNAAPTRLVH